MSGNNLSVLETALMRCGSQKKMAIDLGISEGELSKQVAALRKGVEVLNYLGLDIVDRDLQSALKRLLKEAL